MSLWLFTDGREPYELKPGVDVILGRSTECDLSFYSSMLSREHAAIRWENGLPVLFDLKSLNGTFMGPDRVTRRRLRVGDVFRMGDIHVQVLSSPVPPTAEQAGQAAGGAADGSPEEGNETRPYSRTRVMHLKIFEYDEVGALRGLVDGLEDAIRVPECEGEGLGRWFRATGRRADQLWELLRLGVFVPRNYQVPLRTLSPDDAAQACKVSQRGQKLRQALLGGTVRWNEMAALRYQSRQGPLFPPLRRVARAYRPGGGLASLRLQEVVYELQHIYAAELAAEVFALEMQRMQCIGLWAPTRAAGPEGWYPAAWDDGSCELTGRGRAMLEGMRFEEEEE